MKISNTIPKAVILAAVSLLSPFIKNITATNLINALQEYDNENDKKTETETRLQRPYTISEAMTTFQLSKPSIFKLIRTGKLTRIKLGSATRITAASVEKLINSGDTE